MSAAFLASPQYGENNKSVYLASMRFRSVAFRQTLGIIVVASLVAFWCMSQILIMLDIENSILVAAIVAMVAVVYLANFSTEAEDAQLMTNLMTISDYEEKVTASFVGSPRQYTLPELKVVKCLYRLDKNMTVLKKAIYANADDQRIMMIIECSKNDFRAELTHDTNQMHIFMQKYS